MPDVAQPQPRDRRALAVAIRELRSGERISQEDLSLAAGLHRGFVSELETGRRRVSFESVVLIAEALDVPLTELVERFEAARRRADRIR
jgi:transcriptional regulator with XRE-family HTH domain